MKNPDTLWQQCLQHIAEHVSRHVFDTWFSNITIESYDPATATVLLRLPSRYVYEYIEELHVPLMTGTLARTFGDNVRLQYRIKEPAILPPVEFPALPRRPRIAIANARERLLGGLQHFLRTDTPRWLPAYDDVVQWLTDNKGRGLLCFGTSGLGKSTICRDILPVLLGKSNVVSVSAMEMGQHIDELLRARCVIIDGLGKESVQETVNYRRRMPFYELCDAAVSGGLLLVITTNLATTTVPDNPLYSDSIEHRYGPDVLSRLRAATRAVIFKGENLWQ